MEMYQPTVPMIRRVKLAWINFRMWPGFKWIVRSLVALVILSLLGWGGFMMTPGKRSERLIAHAQEKITEKAWDEAVVAMRKATGIYSNDRPTRWMLANTLFGAGKVQEGIAEMEHALMMPPFDEKTYEQLFQTYYNIMRTSAGSKQLLDQSNKLREVLPAKQQWMTNTLIARAHFINSEFDKSISRFNQVLKDRPHSRRIRIDLAQNLLAAGKAKEALKIYQDILKASLDDAEASHGLATTLALLGKPNEALRAYIRASLVSTNPRLENLLNGALFAMNANQLRDAKVHFIDQLVAHFPDKRESILMQMQYDVLAGNEKHFFQTLKNKMPDIDSTDFTGLVGWTTDRGQPIWGLKMLKEIKPSDLEDVDGQALYINSLIKMRRFDEAKKSIPQVSDKQRQRLLTAKIDLEAGRFEVAKKEFEKLANPENKEITVVSTLAKDQLKISNSFLETLAKADILSRSRILLAQGKAEEVLQLQKNVKEPNAEIQLVGIMAMLALGKEEMATVKLAALTKKNPEREDVWVLWGKLTSSSRPEDALTGIKRAIKAGADGPSLRSLLGEVQYSLGQHSAAINTWKGVVSRWPNSTAGSIDNVFLGEAYMLRNNWAEATKAWEKVLRVAPQDILALNNLAFSLLKTGKEYDRAKHLAEQALLIQPENAEIIDTLEQINKAISSQSKKTSKPKGSAKASAP